MKKINILTLSLSVALDILCSYVPARAMDVMGEKEGLSLGVKPKKHSTIIELIEEKIDNHKKITELYSQPNTPNMALLMAVMMFEGDKSSLEFQELKNKALEASQKQQETPQKIELINQRNAEINKLLPSALLDWHRERMTRSSKGRETFDSTGKVFLGTGVMVGDHTIISIPDYLQTKASQSAYTETDSLTGLHYKMELLTDQNVKWYTERVGLEALMGFWNLLLKDLEENLPFVADGSGEDSIQSRMQQAFAPEPFAFDGFPIQKQLNFNEMMAIGTRNFESLPQSFQEACQNYNLTSTQAQDLLGALRGFEMNLRSYKIVPTWVAFCSSEKIDNVVHDLDPTTPIIKALTTATEGGAFYNVLGILNSRIANACDSTPLSHLSIPLHSFIASKMREFDLTENSNNNKWMITRPLPPMQKIFNISGVPYTESFGDEISPSHPSILREGWYYEDQNGKPIQLYNEKGYAAYVIFDPETKENYQISRNHPFAQNYYLGGISRRDMQLPFVMVNSDILARTYWKK